MKLPVVFRQEAQREFDEAVDWYEHRRAGLGERFVDAIQHVLEQVAANPHRYAAVFSDVREGLVQGFPYCVYYRQETRRIVVLAIFHTSRDPTVWQSRS